MAQVSHRLTVTSSVTKGSSEGPASTVRRCLRHLYKGALCGSVLSGMVLGSLGSGLGMRRALAEPLSQTIAQRIAQAPPTLSSLTGPSTQLAANQTPDPTTPHFDSTGTFLISRSGNPITQRQVRSIWLDRGTIVSAGSPEGLANVFEKFQAAGINTVFVETINAGYPIYDSGVAPEQNPLIQGWDPLQAAVELGRAYDMEVHAWIWTFAAGNQVHNRLVGKPANYPGPILSARPDWAGFDNEGNLIIPGQTKPFLDPANPEVRAYLFDLVSEIVSRYDIDGIQFDYIRYPFQDPGANRLFGYGNSARQQFHQLTGVDPITLSPKNGGDARKAHLWNQWVAFRIQQVTSFVSEASRRIRQQKPHLTISTAVFADPTQKRRHGIQQDWEDWADQGLIDWIVLMSYASNTQRLDELIRPWVVESSYPNTQVIPGIRLLNLPTAVAAEQLRHIQSLPTNGYALFAADNLNSEVQAMLARVNDADALATTGVGEAIANQP